MNVACLDDLKVGEIHIESVWEFVSKSWHLKVEGEALAIRQVDLGQFELRSLPTQAMLRSRLRILIKRFSGGNQQFFESLQDCQKDLHLPSQWHLDTAVSRNLNLLVEGR